MPCHVRAFEEFLAHVRHGPRQLQVFEKARLVVNTARPVVLQPREKDVRLQRIERRRQRLHVSPLPIQPRLALRRIKLRIRIRARRKLPQLRKNKRLLIRDRRHQFRQRIELLRQQKPMHRKIPEVPVLRRLQILRDHLHQPRHIRPRQLRQHHIPLRRTQRRLVAHESLQFLIREPVQAIVLQCLLKKHLPRDQGWIEHGRQIRLRIAHLLHMIKLQPQLLAQILQSLLRVRVVTNQRLAIFNDLPLARIRKPLRPLLHDRGQLRLLPRILIMQCVEKVILLRPRHELLQNRCPILRERKFFDETNLVIRQQRHAGDRDSEEEQGETCLHSHGAFLGLRRQCHRAHKRRNGRVVKELSARVRRTGAEDS